MMIFIGLILLIVYLIGTINGGWFVGAFKAEEALTKERTSEMTDDEKIKLSLKLIIKAILISIFSVIIIILLLSFLIGALNVDTILVPTIVLLALFIYRVVRVGTSKKYREKLNNRTEKEKRAKTRIGNAIYVLYILYILKLLIV